MVWASNDAPVEDTKEFAVLFVLADKAGPDGCDTFPAVPTIAKRTRLSERSVQRALDGMRDRRLIAPGDQSAARYLRVDRKPVVYDLLIPCSWFSNLERINDERARMGRPPLTPSDRPDFPRCQAVTPEESPVTGHGVTESLSRGDTESVYGVSESHPKQSFKENQSLGNTHGASAPGASAPDPGVVEALCRKLADAVKGNNVKRPKITYAWREAAVQLLTPDEDGHAYTVEEIEGGIAWAQADSFWASGPTPWPSSPSTSTRSR